MYEPGTMHGIHGRYYVLNCLKGTSATPCQFHVWAWGVMEAFERAKQADYWPLSVHNSSWSATAKPT